MDCSTIPILQYFDNFFPDVTKTHWWSTSLSFTQDWARVQTVLQHLTSAVDLITWSCS